MMNWKPSSTTPEDKRLVWIISEHGKKVYPSSYTIFGGQVCYSTALHPDWPEPRWRVEQGDERGCGWCSWEPDEILAWCYVEEFTEVFEVTEALKKATVPTARDLAEKFDMPPLSEENHSKNLTAAKLRYQP